MKEKLSILKDCLTVRLQSQQKALFYVTCGVFCAGLFGGMYWLLTPSQPAVSQKSSLKSKKKKIEISGAEGSGRQQEIWVDRLEKTNDIMKKRMDQIEEGMKALIGQRIGSMGSEESSSSLRGIPSDGAEALRGELSRIKEEERLHGSPPPHTFADHGSVPPNGQVGLQAFKKQEIKKITFQLSPLNSQKMGKSVDHYVPAGTFVRGVLTSGVVASTSVSASANPQPVHIQLTDFGNLPRRFKSDIKKCFLIGAAYGDLPSERVFVRLEKFSCVERKTGEVMESNIDGYVSGEDGANGLRGYVVDRSGPAMRNAFIGGFVSGIGNFFAQQQNQPVALAGGLAMMSPLNGQEMMKAGASQGVGAAMEKFSDFYIKRAEQLQPVIEIEPGRRVDVVFKQGFDLNQTLYRRNLMKHNDQDRRQKASDQSEMKGWNSHE